LKEIAITRDPHLRADYFSAKRLPIPVNNCSIPSTFEPTEFNHQPIAAFSVDISLNSVGDFAIHFEYSSISSFSPSSSKVLAKQPLAPVSSFFSVA
jgi:hypothetical protein